MIVVIGAQLIYVGGCVCMFEMEPKQSISGDCRGWSWCVFLQVRSGCAFMVHVCQDEHQLYNEFFSKPTPKLEWVAPVSLVTWSLNAHRKPLSCMYLFKVWRFKTHDGHFSLMCLEFEIPIYAARVDNLYYNWRAKVFLPFFLFITSIFYSLPGMKLWTESVILAVSRLYKEMKWFLISQQRAAREVMSVSLRCPPASNHPHPSPGNPVWALQHSQEWDARRSCS